ncbi:MAG TPA: protein arginine kinase [Anaerohalosphaeraceae bacterium]|nr:protein arginine kinase [Phycisphaerae bacterium]HOK95568.1 protein arginine kinase [Anaerohalosphaeraceae bacterium]HOL31981.1 protein arginine kinase [Anaerohalosphaeraceae bacterium]HOM76415.1 protein arginine kinase [Anaerohalosphaeraceae bacterium]HPC63663.1 protein arginine kinase [Anaerohalosphaeraceae bacterium]
MRPAELCKYPSSWFGGGSDVVSEVVISSRIRLARNIAGYEFLPCLSPARQRQLEDRLREILLSIDLGKKVFFIDIDQASDVERTLLTERYLISRRHALGKGPRGVVIAEDEAFTAMIHEEDHLRIQVFAAGLQLNACWDRINRIDDAIEQKIDYAFDPRLGYLTACPTNLGTGIRVSVMLHLPGLKMTGQMEKFITAARDCDMAVRGLFGEGTEATGDFFQLSNQVTLGISEKQVVEDFTTHIVPRIIAYETQCRQALLEQRPQLLDDKIYRALGVLRSACLISSQEALFLLSNVRLGVNLGRIKNIDIATINELFMLTQPAHLQIRAGRILDPDQRDTLRAEIIRAKLNQN